MHRQGKTGIRYLISLLSPDIMTTTEVDKSQNIKICFSIFLMFFREKTKPIKINIVVKGPYAIIIESIKYLKEG